MGPWESAKVREIAVRSGYSSIRETVVVGTRVVVMEVVRVAQFWIYFEDQSQHGMLMD